MGRLVLGVLALVTPAAAVGPELAMATPAAAAPSSCTGALAGMILVSGSGQVAKVNTAYASPLEATVVDTGGCPLPGEQVEFLTPVTGASAYFAGGAVNATVSSGTNGAATSPALTANTVSGSFMVEAEVVGTGYLVDFDLTNTTAGVATSVSVTAGDSQTAAVGGSFGPLQVRVDDAFGDPVAGATVSFSVVATSGQGATFVGGGTSASAETDQTGQASSPSLTAATTAGAFSVIAAVAGTSASGTFNLTVLPGVPTTVQAGVGTSQTAQLGIDFAVPLAVTVTDSDGNAVPGSVVTFSAPAAGASGVFAGGGDRVSVVANSDGIATAPDFSANQHQGGYVVMATVAGVATPATFALVNERRTSASAPGPDGSYLLVTATGKVIASGAAEPLGSVRGGKPSSPVVAMASAPGSTGYWLATKKGAVYPFGTAVSFPANSNNRPGAKPIVGMAATPDGKGYWLVASDGTIYSYGDAVDYGPAARLHLSQPIVGMAATPDGKGYWLVAADGGVFNYGDAHYYGSMAKAHLTGKIVGMAASANGLGYILVSANGGVFNFGGATFYGSGAGLSPQPVVGVVLTADGSGYWLISANGTATGFGDAGAQGNGAAKGVVGGAA